MKFRVEKKILATLNDAKALVEGQPIGEYKNLLKKFSKLLLIVTVVAEAIKPLIYVPQFML